MNREEFTYPVPLKNYKIEDKFWDKKIEIVQKQMIPYQWKALNDQIPDAAPSHSIRNFKIAAGLETGEFKGCVFQDSDVAKWLEAVGYILTWHKDGGLEETADQVIEWIAAAQQPDGYLDTYYIINGLDKRWTNVMSNHELYCAGHMIEAGIAYYEGTGKRKLLDIVIRLADCIGQTFGKEDGKIHGYPGHEIIEMALVRLYHLVEEDRYLSLAKYFIDERGKSPLYFEEERKKYGNQFYWEDSLFQYQYYQAGLPVREQMVAEGHAVRAVYLYSGMAAVAKETEDDSLWAACRRLWDNIVHRQMYVTGAIGASDYGEAFTFDYDLPNDTVYGETCASIGLIFLARRMLEADQKSEYADVMEMALFNTCLSGMSLDGTKFFYVNPLEVEPKACEADPIKKHVKYERQPWFGCACCPPNLARMLASAGCYAVTVSRGSVAVHLYIGGEVRNPFDDSEFKILSSLPYAGEITLSFAGKKEAECELALRIPGWADSVESWLNGEQGGGVKGKDGYLHFKRKWKAGDTVKLLFGMKIKVNRANPHVREDIGKVAVSRGPLIYCLEEADNGEELHRLMLDTKSSFKIIPDENWGDTLAILAEGVRLENGGWENNLYMSDEIPEYKRKTLKFVPYYLWNNRGPGEMAVWVREKQW